MKPRLLFIAIFTMISAYAFGQTIQQCKLDLSGYPVQKVSQQTVAPHNGKYLRANGEAVDTSSMEQLTFEGRNFFPTWSPDGQWIAYDSNLDSPTGLNFIWKMKIDGTNKQRIAYTPTEGETRQPAWSPDSQKIIHIRYLVGVFSSDIFSMQFDGSNSKRLTENDKTDCCPKYSPEDTLIAFESDAQVWVMNAAGENLKQVTFGEQGRLPAWSPDGEEIVYIGPKGTIWVMSKDAKHHRQLTYTYRPEGPNKINFKTQGL